MPMQPATLFNGVFRTLLWGGGQTVKFLPPPLLESRSGHTGTERKNSSAGCWSPNPPVNTQIAIFDIIFTMNPAHIDTKEGRWGSNLPA